MKGGGYDVGTYGGSTNSRSVHRFDITGLQIVQILVQRSILNGVHIKEHRWGTKLIHDGTRCHGVIAFNKETGEAETYYAKSVVLATGGGACVYPIASISFDKLASGILMGYEAGLPLVDMEMVQFHPTGVLVKGHPLNGCLLEEEMRTQGGVLLNRDGKRYMFDYDSRAESATRDIVARSTYLEIMNGRGTDNGGVMFDISKFSKEKIKARFPQTVKRLRACDIDLLKQNQIEISPTAHFLMGGLEIDENGATGLKGLFACGEDAGGIHGGNRLGGNGVADALVFGYKAGVFAAKHADKVLIQTGLKDNAKINYYDLSTSEIKNIDQGLKQIMWENVGLVRSKDGLTKALNYLEKTKKNFQQNIKDYDVKSGLNYPSNLISGKTLMWKMQLATLIATSSLLREDSIGAHYRLDFDNKIKNANKYNTTITKKGCDFIIDRKAK